MSVSRSTPTSRECARASDCKGVTRERCFDGALRIGLVLGAGGLVGLAHHAGSLAALELNLGWDPRSADVIVGSSAGSIVATLLRASISLESPTGPHNHPFR